MIKIDKDLIRRRFAKNFPYYENEAIVQRKIAEELSELIIKFLPAERNARALELGIGTGFLSRKLISAYPKTEWFLNDISPEAFENFHSYGGNASQIIGDAETALFPRNLTLIASASTIQWFQNIAAFFKKSHEAISPEGILAVSTFGPENFLEIRETLERSLEYPTIEQLDTFATKAGFYKLDARERQEKIFFKSPMEVLKHIKNTGVNAIRSESWTRAKLNNFSKKYADKYSDENGNVSLTYHPISVIFRNGNAA